MNVIGLKEYKLLNEFNNLKNDVDRWKWILKNQNKHIKIMLDNDDTYGVFDHIEESPIFQFDEYIGYDTGVLKLLKAVGIYADYV